MPRFRLLVTRAVTQSIEIEVEAVDAETAKEWALTASTPDIESCAARDRRTHHPSKWMFYEVPQDPEHQVEECDSLGDRQMARFGHPTVEGRPPETHAGGPIMRRAR